jgi:hypothetical protein
MNAGGPPWPNLEVPMKRALLALALLTLPALAFADAPAASLKDNMKAIGKLYKSVQATVGDRGQNTANAASAGQMATLFTAVAKQVPDSITQLPPNQQKAALADFQRLINAEEKFAESLKAAFAAGDNTAAADIVNKMNLDKKEGHDKYNKD